MKPTVRTVLSQVVALVHERGGPLFEKGDWYAKARAECPESFANRTVMLDDSSGGWYVAVRLAPRQLPPGDSMHLFASTVAGAVNMDVELDLPRGSREGLSDDVIMDLPLRPESAGSRVSCVSVGFDFEDGGRLRRCGFSPRLWVNVDLETGALTPWYA